MGILEENTKTVPFYKLFSFSDSTDVLLMIVGSIGAIVNGVCSPLMTLLFGDLIDALGQNQNNEEIVEIVSKVRKKVLLKPKKKKKLSFELLFDVYFIMFRFV